MFWLGLAVGLILGVIFFMLAMVKAIQEEEDDFYDRYGIK